MRTMAVMMLAAGLGGCAGRPAPPDVATFVDDAGLLIGAAERCDPRLAAHATTCARHTVATWPGGLDEGVRLEALRRLDDVRSRASEGEGASCRQVAESLRQSTVWQGCYWRRAS